MKQVEFAKQKKMKIILIFFKKVLDKDGTFV